MLPADVASSIAEPGPSLLGSALRMLAAMALLGAGAWLLVRWRRAQGSSRRELQVLDRVDVARGASIAVLRAGERRLLVGVSGEGVRLLCDLGERADGSFPAALADAEARKENPS